MSHSNIGWTFVIPVAGMLVGCGGGSEGMPDGITAEAACDAWAQSFCQKEMECDPLMQAYYGSPDDCVRIGKNICPLDFGLPGSKDSPAATAACAKVAATVSCDDFIGQVDYCGLNTGTLANGTACYLGGQCASGHCQTTSADGCGVCGDPSALGGPCVSADDCATELACLIDANGKGSCAQAVAAGAPCTATNVLCRPGFFCAADGTCRAQGAENDGCTTPDSCADAQGLACGDDGKCHKQTFVGAGASCTVSINGVPPLCIDGTCNTGSGKCEASLKVGEACQADAAFLCEVGLACVGGRCSPLKAPTCR